MTFKNCTGLHVHQPEDSSHSQRLTLLDGKKLRLTVRVNPGFTIRQPDFHVILEILHIVDDAATFVKDLRRHRLDVRVHGVS